MGDAEGVILLKFVWFIATRIEIDGIAMLGLCAGDVFAAGKDSGSVRL